MVLPLVIVGLVAATAVGGAVIAHQRNVSMPQHVYFEDDPYLDGFGDQVRASDEDLDDDEDVSEEEFEEIALALQHRERVIEEARSFVPVGLSVEVSDEFAEDQEDLLEEMEGADNIFVS